MAMRRACTYSATISLPEDSSNYSALRVSFGQKNQQIINKNIGDDGMTVNSDNVVVTLTQEETLFFQAGSYAILQIRAYKNEYEAPGSKCWPIEVFDSINTEVLP